MSQQIINVGEAPNDGTGEPLRSAFTAVNNNFDQVWAAGPVGSQVVIVNNTITTTETNLDLVLHANGIGNITVYNSITPWTDSVYDLGSTDHQFDTVWARYYRGNASQMTGLPVMPDLTALATDLIPNANLAYDIGAGTQRWATVFAGTGDFSRDVTIRGNLVVVGNVIEMGNSVTDSLTLHLANSVTNAAGANGAGITVGANANIATILYNSSSNIWQTNVGIGTGNIIIQGDNIFDIAGPAITNGDLSHGSTSGLDIVTNGDANATILYNTYGNVKIYASSTGANVHSFEFGSNGNVTLPGNVSAEYFIGNGSQLTGLPAGYANANAVAYANSGWAGNIIPSGNAAYSLGNSTNQWSDLYVSNATIYMNNIPVSLTDGNVLTVNGQAILSNDSNTTINTTGNITADYFFGDGSQLTGIQTTGNIEFLGTTMYIDPDALDTQINISPDGEGWAYLQLPNNDTANVTNTRLHNDAGNVEIGAGDFSNSGPSYEWIFGKDGNLYLPNNGDINFNAGGIVQEVDEDLHITVQDAENDGWSLMLDVTDGTDVQSRYEQRTDLARIRLGMSTVDKTWQFDDSGRLSIPGDIWTEYYGNASIVARGVTDSSFVEFLTQDASDIRRSNITLTRDTATITTSSGSYNWTFGVDGNLTVPGNIQSIDTDSWPFNSTITGITTGAQLAIVSLTDNVFPDAVTGQVTISGVVGTTEANATWYYQAVETNQFQLYHDAACTIPVDGAPWTAYVSGGTAVAVTYKNLSITGGNIQITANGTSTNSWLFSTNGTFTPPTLTVDLHNGGNQSGQVLQFGDVSQQVIITGPTPEVDSNAQRLIIQGQRGNGSGEGGDVYLWGGDADTNGGDIKIYAGDADNGSTGSGGYVNIEGGSGWDIGGYVSLTAGQSSNGQGATASVNGGYGATQGGDANINGGYGSVDGGHINIQGGYAGGSGAGGNVNIIGGGSGIGLPNYGNINITAGASTWTFDNSGNLSLPGGGIVYGSPYTPSGAPGNTITLQPAGSGAITDQRLLVYPTAGDGDHIHLTSGNLYQTELFLGSDNLYVKLSASGNIVVNSNDGTGNTAQWNFGTDGATIFPGNITGSGASPAPMINGFSTIETVDGANLAGTGFNISGITLIGDTGVIESSANNVSIYSDSGQLNGILFYGDGAGNDGVDIYAGQGLAIFANNAGSSNETRFLQNGSISLPSKGFIYTFTGGDNGGLTLYDTDNNNQAELAAIGNVNLRSDSNNAGSEWIFDTTGNLTAPGNIFTSANISAAYFIGNGSQLTGLPASYSDSNVATFLASYGSNTISTSGNITAGNLIGNIGITDNVVGVLSNVELVAGAYTWTFNNTGNMVLPGNTFAVNYANGTAVSLGGNYGDSNVVSLLSAFGSNTVSTTGNVTGGNLISSGSIFGNPDIVLGNTANASATKTRIVSDTTFSYIQTGNGTVGSTGNIVFSPYSSTTQRVVIDTSSGNLNASGNVTAQNFVGNISITGNVTGTQANVTLVAGSYSYIFDNTGVLTMPRVGGDEGGQINFSTAAANTTLGNPITVDIFQNKLRIFEATNSNGVYVDLSKAPAGVGGELLWKSSGLVNAGVDVTLGNLKARIPTSGNRSLQVSTVSGTYSVYGSNLYYAGGAGGSYINNGAPVTVTTTPGYLNSGLNFTQGGYTDTWTIMDTSNIIAWRITCIIGAGFNNNMISIERLV